MSMMDNDTLIDFSQIPDEVKQGQGVTIVPDGTYHLQIWSAVKKPNKAQTGEIIELTFKVLEPGFEEVKLKDWPSLSAAASWKLIGILNAFTGEDWNTKKLTYQVLQELPGKIARAIVVTEPHYQKANQLTNKINDYLPDDGAFAGMSKAEFAPTPGEGYNPL